MSWCSDVTAQTARKQHRCSWCDMRIEIGESYLRYVGTPSDGWFAVVKLHPECDEAMQAETEMGGDEITFVPGDHERPGKDGE